MDFTKQSQNILSLCTGIRGLERGIERAGVELNVVTHVEIEAFVIENLVQQMEKSLLAPAPIWTNLKTFDAKPFYGKVHGITGGYPCQPFSTAGKRRGKDDPRHLWPYIKDMVGAIRPLWCFFENVHGHLTFGYREVRSDLEQLGYKVEEGIFSAEEVGAPHLRKRLFILAMDNANYRRYGRQKKEIQSGGHAFEPSNKELADSKYDGHDGSEIRESLKKGNGNKTRSKNGWQSSGCGELADCQNKQFRLGDTWPARPGQKQFEWEEPRVEEKDAFTCMGGTDYGYNFREDLLRLFGNAVVEQTAELAWKTLINKFK